MILDLGRFIENNRRHWKELENLLDRFEAASAKALDFDTARRLHYLYERCSADLARISTFTSEPETRAYLSSLASRAYAVIYQSKTRTRKFDFLHWFFHTFPCTFRCHAPAFWLAVALTLAGTIFGALALLYDAGAKQVIMPFEALQGEPGERVQREERGSSSELAGHHGSFSAQLMTHNTRIAIFTLALGVTWGIGPALLLFYNGVLLGAVALDYVRAGYTMFLLGWLLPHGVIEIPAIVIAGQAGFVLAGALIGSGDRTPRRTRLRETGPAVVTLAAGAGLLLVWAGLMESFVSQFHQPVIPYSVKIGFGVLELLLLCAFLTLSGRATERS